MVLAIEAHPVFWLGAAGSLGLTGPGRARRVGAGLLVLGAATAFGLCAAGSYAATANFGVETDTQAAQVVEGAAVGLLGVLAVAAALGLAPERSFRGWARWPGVLLTIAAWGLTAWLGTSAACVYAALSPLSAAQSVRTWGPALISVVPLVWLAARAGRPGWVGALLLPVCWFALLSPSDRFPAEEASTREAIAAVAAGPNARTVREGKVVSIPVTGPWRGPAGAYVIAPGRDARPGEGTSGAFKRSSRKQVVPGFPVPVVRLKPDRVRSWLVRTGEDAGELDRDWTPAPPLTPANLDAAIEAGAGFLERNQLPGGKFTYIVKGPGGESGPGYNYPRHAGTAWFLARVATAFDDTPARESAVLALGHLQEVSGHTTDGRAFVLDPTRKDGRAWIGTTALAVLAVETLSIADDPGWRQQVIASVGPDGKARGEIWTATGEFVEDDANSYGQGQVMLALTAIARSGTDPSYSSFPFREAAIEALQRASRYVAGMYETSHPLWVGDEHWMCLAAHGIHAVNALATARNTPTIDTAGPDGVCRTYAALQALEAPPSGAGLPPSAGAAGGAAEAVVARAWDTGSPALKEAALEYGAFFLGCQYQPGDAPLLSRPDRLLGGFRDGPYDLDVQIDAVQHIGGALLGVRALVDGSDGPGRLP